MKMGDQEQNHNGSSRSSRVGFRNGRQPKKPKPKKIPQRGMGVAQLEKIRLEEEKNITSSPLSPYPANGIYNGSPSAFPFSTQNQAYTFSNDGIYGHVPCHPHLNVRQHSIFPVEPRNNLQSSDYIQENSTRTLHNQTTHEPTPMSSFAGIMPHGNRQSSIFPFSMVTAVATDSSSTVLNLQTEPPSNQSFHSNFRSLQPYETEKTVGMKRTCPFSLQEPPEALVHWKPNPFPIQSLGKSASYSNARSLVISRNPSLGDSLQCSISTPIRTDNRISDGGFLKLAPPATMSLLPSSKSDPTTSYLHTQHPESLKVDSTPPTVHALSSDTKAGSDISIRQHLPFHRFFPGTSHHSPEMEEHVDLNLRL